MKNKIIPLFLVIILAFTIFPQMALALPNVTTFERDGVTAEFHLNSNWNSGYNAELRIINNRNYDIDNWVLHVNRNLGLTESFRNNGLFVYQSDSVTTIRHLYHNSYIPSGGSISIWAYSTTNSWPNPSDFRLTTAVHERLPYNYYTLSVANYNEWAPNYFHHAIILQNISDRLLQGWRVEFDIIGGATINSIDSSNFYQLSPNEGVAYNIPRSTQAFHSGQVLHLGIHGSKLSSSVGFENIRVYHLVAHPYTDFSEVIEEPIPEGRYELIISTNYRGNAFTTGRYFYPGEVVEITVIPDRSHYLYEFTSNIGNLYTDNYFTFFYVMPSQTAFLNFNFNIGRALESVSAPYEYRVSTEPTLTIRDFNYYYVQSSSLYENLYFMRGQLIVIAEKWITKEEFNYLVELHGGEIVGFLEIANTYQLFFEEVTTEAELWSLYNLFNAHDFVVHASLNLYMPYVYEPPFERPASRDFHNDISIGGLETEEPTPDLRRFFRIATLRSVGAITAANIERARVEVNDEYFVNEHMWGLEHIRAPLAWSHNYRIENPVNIGILDSHFIEHEDLSNITFFRNYFPLNRRIPADELNWLSTQINYGIHVAGTIGADANNEIGIPGIVNNVNLYGYALFGTHAVHASSGTPLFSYQHGVATMLQNDARIINVSMGFPAHSSSLGATFDVSSNEARRIEAQSMGHFLDRFYQLGFDFLIVQAAGNASNREGRGWTHTGYNGIFVNIGANDYDHNLSNVNDTENVDFRHLRYRIIVVGNEQNGIFRVSDRSQIGNRVDIFAPGTEIYSTGFRAMTNNEAQQKLTSDYVSSYIRRISGTSMAAPHVSAVAGMVWGANPNLTAIEVRNILIYNGGASIASPVVFHSPFPSLDAYAAMNMTPSYSPRTYRNLHGMIVNASSIRPGSYLYIEPSPQPPTFVNIYSYETGRFVTSGVAISNGLRTVFTVPGLYSREKYIVRGHRHGMYIDEVVIDMRTQGFLTLIANPTRRSLINVDNIPVVNPGYNTLYPIPHIENDRFIAPANPFTNALGFETYESSLYYDIIFVEEDETERRRLDIRIGSETFTVVTITPSELIIESNPHFLDRVLPYRTEEHIFLPVRSIAEALNFIVEDVIIDDVLHVDIFSPGFEMIISPFARRLIHPNEFRQGRTVTTIPLGSEVWRGN